MINETIRVFVITYRRHKLLERALKSLIAQSYKNWVAEVINDDPSDKEVINIINSLADDRIFLKSHPKNLGPTRNFNYCFSSSPPETYASILEDDNWWESDFLLKMRRSMHANPDIKLAVANEKIWKEEPGNIWIDLEQTIWPKIDGFELYEFIPIDQCGPSKLCNSSLLWKTSFSKEWVTPDDLPVDVSEHFRELVIPHPILLVNEPLVNFSQTIETARSNKASIWGLYQVLLVTSVFSNINFNEQQKLAKELWQKAVRESDGPQKTTLLHSALAHKSARSIFRKATLKEMLRYLLTWLKSPVTCYHTVTAIQRKPEHFQFLKTAFKQTDFHSNHKKV